MNEESLVMGRPPRPPRRPRTGRGASWGGRIPHLAATLAVVVLAGWALWQGVLESPAPRRAAMTPSPPAPSATTSAAPRFIPRQPPAVPFLRAGVLTRPNGQSRVVPDGVWTDLAELADDRVVLVQRGSLTVVSPDRRPRRYPIVGGITARPNGAAVAWTAPDGRLRRLSAGNAEPVVVPGARQLVPACRGLRIGGRARFEWQICDRDGGLLSPGGRYFASVGVDTVTLAPRADITAGIAVGVPGRIMDAVWEDSFNVLVAVDVDGLGHLIRIGLGGEYQDLIAPVLGLEGDSQQTLVLPLTSGWTWTELVVQP